jgi:hypothetical protein
MPVRGPFLLFFPIMLFLLPGTVFPFSDKLLVDRNLLWS